MIENSRRLHPGDVRRHVVGTCFKTGPPGTVGAETEWFVTDPREPGAPVPGALVRAAVEKAGPPPGGSTVTYEPGGQLELSSAPFPGLAPLHRALTGDIAHVRAALAPAGLALSGHGVDPHRPPGFQSEHPRYACMRDYYVARGFTEVGPQMMCSTASVQVNLDIGADAADAARRWRLVHALGPVLVAAFANSPRRAGVRTGWASTRQAIWTELDPCRTGSVLRDPAENPADAWTRYALDARVMLVRGADDRWISDPGMTFGEWLRKGEPTAADLEYHLSTLFPPVRPRGWLELRMIDALPEPYWAVPVAVATALLDDPRASAAAEAATALLDAPCVSGAPPEPPRGPAAPDAANALPHTSAAAPAVPHDPHASAAAETTALHDPHAPAAAEATALHGPHPSAAAEAARGLPHDPRASTGDPAARARGGSRVSVAGETAAGALETARGSAGDGAAALDYPRASAAAEAASALLRGSRVSAAAGSGGGDWWLIAARYGLADPVLADVARACFDAALEALPRMGAGALVPIVAEYADRYVERGLSPALAEETSRC